MSHQLIYFALEGLRYYHTYDRVFLGLSVALGFLGWSAYVIILVLRQHTDLVPSEPQPEEYKGLPEAKEVMHKCAMFASNDDVCRMRVNYHVTLPFIGLAAYLKKTIGPLHLVWTGALAALFLFLWFQSSPIMYYVYRYDVTI